MKLTSGTTLRGGKYTIIEPIGQGTFGITYLAIVKLKVKGDLGEIEVPTKVAIKEFFMNDINSRDAGSSEVKGSSGTIFCNYLEKFRKEAKHLADLHHPGIVRVLEVFDENNTSYYAMEYIEGRNLDAVITDNTKLNEGTALEIIRKIGEALHYMHSKSMLHLDVKPGNVMVDPDGGCHLIDFGLSKQFTEDGVPESSTRIGLGTPGYAPLEQSHFKQDGSFPATLDVYALGATLYKMLTGKRAPEASAVLNEGLDISLLKKARVSYETIGVLLKAMAPFRKLRYQNIQDFMTALPAIKDENVSPYDDRGIVVLDANDENVKFEDNEETTIEDTIIDEKTKRIEEKTKRKDEKTEIKYDYSFLDDDVEPVSDDEYKKLHRKDAVKKKSNLRILFYSIIAAGALIIGYFSSKSEGTGTPDSVSGENTGAVTEELFVDTAEVVEEVYMVAVDSAL